MVVPQFDVAFTRYHRMREGCGPHGDVIPRSPACRGTPSDLIRARTEVKTTTAPSPTGPSTRWCVAPDYMTAQSSFWPLRCCGEMSSTPWEWLAVT